VPFREETFLAIGAVGGFLKDAGGGTAEPLAGEAGLNLSAQQKRKSFSVKQLGL
jgi:hypothetical protein